MRRWPDQEPNLYTSGRCGASIAQEPASTEPLEEHTKEQAAEEPVLAEDELTPPKPFYFDADAHMAQEEAAHPLPKLAPQLPTPLCPPPLPQPSQVIGRRRSHPL